MSDTIYSVPADAEKLQAAQTAYPALMAYILDRNTVTGWCSASSHDDENAFNGELADVAADLTRAQADYGSYPYNASMGRFLGLAIKAGNHEPEHGYYMASSVHSHYRLGVALREARQLIEAGRTLAIAAARSKKTGKVVRTHKFAGAQITLPGFASGGYHPVVLNNGKVSCTLHGGYSRESQAQGVMDALKSGQPYRDRH